MFIQILQQCILCKGGGDQLDGDELPGSGFLVWGGLRVECNPCHLQLLLLNTSEGDVLGITCFSSKVALLLDRRRIQQLPAEAAACCLRAVFWYINIDQRVVRCMMNRLIPPLPLLLGSMDSNLWACDSHIFMLLFFCRFLIW